jgi:hypothetical protein
MLMSSVIDPIVLDTERFVDNSYSQNMERYLLGIIDNGLLVIDPSEKLKNDLFSSADKLGQSARGINSRILLEEILKQGKKKIVKALPCHSPASQLQRMEYACHIKNQCQADMFLTCRDQIDQLQDKQDGNVVVMEDYTSFHPSETRRHRLATSNFQVNKIDVAEFHKLLIGVIRFSKWIRFYDSQIGHGGGNLWSFREGIKLILTLYRDYGYFAQEPGMFIEIYTKQHVLDDLAFKRINSELLVPLRILFPLWKIRLFIKDDPHSIFHARFLESQNAIISVDSGFDLFQTNGDLRTNFIRLDQDRTEHLETCRKLIDLYKET